MVSTGSLAVSVNLVAPGVVTTIETFVAAVGDEEEETGARDGLAQEVGTVERQVPFRSQ